MRELARDYTIVVVTHNIAQAQRIAEHCVFMLDGEVLAAGTREEILDRSAPPDGARFRYRPDRLNSTRGGP